ncbi:hypothetical protein SeLEV6574_g02743 [Synchytrium endobioticum]|uniref:Uncharacterized protein n=1 Tax=Synchytrium endobioticum TaxID=286115 RepID=A0A507D742_9FUNG|nr:hypothetical protein SeLEV6574_g02743 [Synchytrium endobioticum]
MQDVLRHTISSLVNLSSVLFYHVKGHHFNAVTSLALSKRRMLLGCEPYCLCHGVSGKQAESQDSAIIATQMGPGASCKQDGTCAGGCRMFLRHTIVSLCIQLGIAKHAPTVCDRDYNAARNILYCLLCRAPSSLQARHQYRLGLTTTLNSSRRATHVEGIQNNNAFATDYLVSLPRSRRLLLRDRYRQNTY